MAKRTTRKRASGSTKRRTVEAAGTGKRSAGRSARKGQSAKSGTSARRSRTKGDGTGQASVRKTAARKAVARKTARKAVARKTVARKAGSARTSPRKAAVRAVPAPKPPTGNAAGKSSALGKAATAVRGTLAGAVAAVKRTVTSGPPDAIALLENDHRRMQKLLEQGQKTTRRSAARRTELLDTLTAELRAHELLEETVLYPALEAHPESRDVTLEGLQEHHLADVVVAELHGVAPDEEEWTAKFTVLKENLDHHIEDEEGGMFRIARGLFSQDELDAMGAKMAAMKAERGPQR